MMSPVIHRNHMTNEQKKALPRLISGFALVILLLGIFTSLWSFEVGLVIALAIWILHMPLLKLLGFAPEKVQPSAPGGAPIETPRRVHSPFWQYLGVLIPVVIILLFGFSWIVGRGSGTLTTETRDVTNFSRVELSGTGNLVITQGETESLKIEAEDNLIGKIKSTVSGGTLKIGPRNEFLVWNFWPTEDITYTLSVKDLSRVSVSGSASVTSTKLSGDALEIRISGSGEVTLGVEVKTFTASISGSGSFALSGIADTLDVDISGSGKIQAENLVTNDTKVKISGSGKAVVNAAKTLGVTISGSGNVEYVGTPAVTQSISGSGDIGQFKGTVQAPPPATNANTNTGATAP